MLELIIPGLMMGFVGGAHCAGMCGPLIISLACARAGKGNAWMGALVYQSGRLASYLLVGVGFAIIGSAFSMVGWQQTLSIIAGVAVLAGVFFGSKWMGNPLIARWVLWIKHHFSARMRSTGLRSTFGLGMINGFLPCGLVYVAGASAASYGHAVAAMVFMAAFGLGTFPLMLALQFSGNKVSPSFRMKLQKLIPVMWGVMGVLLILRGLNLGIPYLSPHFSGLNGACPHCH